MSKKLIISLEDDGKVYRGAKLIATVEGGEIKFKHYSYKKHAQEIEMLMEGDVETLDDPVEEAIEEDEASVYEQADAPKELFAEGNGIWYGELNPPVVDWRKKHWSTEDFEAKYGGKEELLTEIYHKHDLIYDRNNN